MTKTSQEAPKTNKTSNKTSVDVSRALKLREVNGLSYQEIGDMEGVSKQRIHQLLQPLLPDQNLIKSFQSNQADILSYAQFKALSAYLSLDDAEQKSMISKRGFVDMGIAFDKQRLLLGLSTANIAYDPGQAREELNQLRQLLSDAEVKVSDMGIHMGVCDNEPGK